MSPKTAIIILLILFLLGVFIFAYLFAIGHFSPKQPLNRSVPIKIKDNEIEDKRVKLEEERINILEKLNQQKRNLTPKDRQAREEERLQLLQELNKQK